MISVCVLGGEEGIVCPSVGLCVENTAGEVGMVADTPSIKSSL